VRGWGGFAQGLVDLDGTNESAVNRRASNGPLPKSSAIPFPSSRIRVSICAACSGFSMHHRFLQFHLQCAARDRGARQHVRDVVIKSCPRNCREESLTLANTVRANASRSMPIARAVLRSGPRRTCRDRRSAGRFPRRLEMNSTGDPPVPIWDDPSRQTPRSRDPNVLGRTNRLVQNCDRLALDGAAEVPIPRQPVRFCARASPAGIHRCGPPADALGMIHRTSASLMISSRVAFGGSESASNRAGEKNPRGR